MINEAKAENENSLISCFSLKRNLNVENCVAVVG